MNTLYILGAGASRGHGARKYPKPPTVHEFFHRRFMSKLQNKYSSLFKSLNNTLERSEISLDNVNIEQLFSVVEPIWELSLVKKKIKSYSEGPPHATDFITPLDMLHSWVVDVIHLSTGWLRQRSCPLHQELACQAVARNETIISFNYDLIMDFALLRTKEWSVKSGYGWNSHGKTLSFSSNTDYESTSSDIETCLILKPHGSINFFKSTRGKERANGRGGKYFSYGKEPEENVLFEDHLESDCIEIRDPNTTMMRQKDKSTFGSPPFVGPTLYDSYANLDPITKQILYKIIKANHDLSGFGQLPCLVMPTPFKSIMAMRFAELNIIWNLVSQAVKRATKIISIGFTFCDPHFNAILADSTRSSLRPKQLVVVSPRKSTINDITKRIKATGLKVEPFCGTFADFIRSNLSK
ncbi:MAG: hypothetical protein GY839_21220 [candidate division Zixibacteria bacterium]|nr:hypothetical protein [candidate division Zixibacteria bacterium]